jgi:hypothetical protein
VVIPTSALDSDLRIESNAGTFTDEATGTATTAGTLAAFITGGTLTTGSVHIDRRPHHPRPRHGKQQDPWRANRIFNAAFGYTPDTSVARKRARLVPMRPRPRSFEAMAFSQMTWDMNYAGQTVRPAGGPCAGPCGRRHDERFCRVGEWTSPRTSITGSSAH